MKSLHATGPARQPGPQKIRGQVRIEVHKRSVFWFYFSVWLACVGVDFVEQVRALGRSKEDIDARILLQPLDDRSDCRIIHRSPAIDEDLPSLTTAISLPTLVEPTQPLDVVT